MLMNHPNMILLGYFRIRNRYWLSVNMNFTRISMIEPIQNVHQRRFPSTILSKKTMNFPSLYFKIDMIKSFEFFKGFGDLFHAYFRHLLPHR